MALIAELTKQLGLTPKKDKNPIEKVSTSEGRIRCNGEGNGYEVRYKLHRIKYDLDFVIARHTPERNDDGLPDVVVEMESKVSGRLFAPCDFDVNANSVAAELWWEKHCLEADCNGKGCYLAGKRKG